MKVLNDYGELQLTNTMSDLVELFNNNTENNKLVDGILSYVLDTGVFRSGEEKVNNLSIGPHNNLEIPFSQVASINFTGFYFYFKSLHKIFTTVPPINLSTYNDSKLHLLYIKSDLTPVVLDSLYSGSEDYSLLARFIIKSDAIIQFYVCTRNAGTNPFDKDGVNYEVISGLVPYAKSGLTLHVSNGVIKYSGINMNSATSTDILAEDLTDVITKLMYITTENKADWINDAGVTDIITNKVFNYSTKTLSDVATDKFVCQKAYYDYMTQRLVVQYGSVIYSSYNEALAGASNFNYDEPDFSGAYIPLAVFVIKSGATDLTASGNFKVISITDKSNLSAATAVDPTAQALANSALAAAQAAQADATSGISKADAAQTDATSGISKADAAQTDATKANTNLTAHLNDTNNPHSVTKAQVGLGKVDNTTDAEKPLSTPQKTYVDNQVSTLNTSISKKPNTTDVTQARYQSNQPTSTDFGRPLIKGDLWLIP